jgi:hypothetical protein
MAFRAFLTVGRTLVLATDRWSEAWELNEQDVRSLPRSQLCHCGLRENADVLAAEITQFGAGHGQYVDPGAEAMMAACAPGTAVSEWVRASAAAYLTSFFPWQLHGDDAAGSWLEERLETDEEAGLIAVQWKLEQP